MPLSDLRREYDDAGLSEADMLADPIQQLRAWLDIVIANPPGDWFEPNAMTLATSDGQGHVSARVVLLKNIDEQGRLVFFTNYGSHKAGDLETNPRAALCFYWGQLGRQVRVEGAIDKTDRETSAAYFASRPRRSQLGAAASDQSRIVESRAALEAQLAALEKQYEGRDIPVPEGWGGYQLAPTRFEFWQGRRSRLHDRIVYHREGESWKMQRLGP